MRALNAISSILILPLIPIITVLALPDYFSIFGNSIFTIILLVVALLTVFVCYISAAFLGLVGMATGKRRVVRTNAIFQKILFAVEIILESVILYSHRNSSDSFERGWIIAGIVILAILFFTAVIRSSALKDVKELVVFDGQPVLTVITIIVFIVIPIVIVAFTKALLALIEAYPIVKTILTVIGALPLIIVAVLFGLVCKGESPSVTTSSSSGGNDSGVENLTKKRDAYVDALNKHNRGVLGYDYIDPKSQQNKINMLNNQINNKKK